MSDENDVKSLLAQIQKALGRAKSEDDGGGDNKGAVPYERFFKVNQRALAAEQALEALGGKVEDMEKAHASKLDELKQTAASEVAQLGQRHQEDLGLVDLGFDADGRAALRAAYQRLPEAQRPKTVVDYWKGQMEAHQAHAKDPDKAEAPSIPRTLTPYLPNSGQQQRSPGSAEGGRSTGRQVPGIVVGQRLGVDRGVVPGGGTSPAEAAAAAGSWAELEKSLR